MKFRLLVSRLSLFLLISFMALVSSAAEPAAVQVLPDGVQKVDLTADSYSYSPDHLVVNLGAPVELTIHNKSWMVPHNFVLKDADSGLNIEKDIPSGKTEVVKFTPTHPGKFKFYCNKKLLFFKSHEEKGMKGIIEVKGIKVPEIPSLDPVKPEAQ